MCRYVDQGGGKRPGAFAIYIEPWHADIFDVLELRKNTGTCSYCALIYDIIIHILVVIVVVVVYEYTYKWL